MTEKDLIHKTTKNGIGLQNIVYRTAKECNGTVYEINLAKGRRDYSHYSKDTNRSKNKPKIHNDS
jgi:hypothetical protein